MTVFSIHPGWVEVDPWDDDRPVAPGGRAAFSRHFLAVVHPGLRLGARVVLATLGGHGTERPARIVLRRFIPDGPRDLDSGTFDLDLRQTISWSATRDQAVAILKEPPATLLQDPWADYWAALFDYQAGRRERPAIPDVLDPGGLP